MIERLIVSPIPSPSGLLLTKFSNIRSSCAGSFTPDPAVTDAEREAAGAERVGVDDDHARAILGCRHGLAGIHEQVQQDLLTKGVSGLHLRAPLVVHGCEGR